MDWNRLRDLVTRVHMASYRAGLEKGRAEVAKDIESGARMELDFFLQKCEAEAKEPAPSPAPAKEERRNKDGVRLVCGNCKFIGVDWVKKQNICQKRNFVTDQERPCCNLFDPSIAALVAASNDAVCTAVEKKAEAETTGTTETAGTEEERVCGDCKHMGACMATSSRELGQPPPEHAACELFEPKEEP